MPQFTWTSRDQYDIVRSGIITAPTAGKASAALAARSMRPHAVLPLPSAARATENAPLAPDLGSIRDVDLLQTLREMVSLLRHGVNRQRVFTALGAVTPNPVLAEVLQSMGQRTQSGVPLYRAMAAWPGLFDEVVQHLVRHGEGENRLAECIKTVHAYLEFKHAMLVLDDQLKGKPPALTRQAREEIAHGRLLACLAAGQDAGLSMDVNLALAARHCGDDSVAARVQQAWDSQQASSPAPSPSQALQRILVASGLVQAEAWQTASARTNGDLAAVLQALTQDQSARAIAATEALARQLQTGLKTTVRAAGVAMVVLAWFYLMR